MLALVMRGRFRLFRELLKFLGVLLSLFLCLFADSSAPVTNSAIHSIARDFAAISRDPGTQWMAFLCVAINLLTFLLLESQISGLRFWRAANPSVWLTGVLTLGTLAYTFNYSNAAQSTQALMLLGGAALGSGASVWAVWRQQDSHRESVGRLIVTALVVLLVAASLWPPEWGPTFAFLGDTRWTGPWSYPNTYGLLMGVGVVLAVGSTVVNFKPLVFRKGQRTWWKVSLLMLCTASAGLMGRGLVHSYSRGAWLGTIIGLTYLTVRWITAYRSKFNRWICANAFSLALGTVSILTLTFWHFRQTEWHPSQRAFSLVNSGDATWRNRVATWKSASQIMAEHPWFGAGWNHPAALYLHYYFRTEIHDPAPIELNDYLWLGATLGILALVCFGMYIWLCFRNSRCESETGNLATEDSPLAVNSKLWTLDSLQATCRAGAIVLLVGFWFDGGLFRLPTAATFWILIELGRRDLTTGSVK